MSIKKVAIMFAFILLLLTSNFFTYYLNRTYTDNVMAENNNDAITEDQEEKQIVIGKVYKTKDFTFKIFSINKAKSYKQERYPDDPSKQNFLILSIDLELRKGIEPTRNNIVTYEMTKDKYGNAKNLEKSMPYFDLDMNKYIELQNKDNKYKVSDLDRRIHSTQLLLEPFDFTTLDGKTNTYKAQFNAKGDIIFQIPDSENEFDLVIKDSAEKIPVIIE